MIFTLVTAPVHADTDVPAFLSSAIALCADTESTVSERMDKLIDDAWTTTSNSERLLDLWTQGDLATHIRKPGYSEAAVLEGYAKRRKMAVDWVSARISPGLSLSNIADLNEGRRDGTGTIGLLLEHSDWSGVFEIQMGWTSAASPVDRLSCLFISEDVIPETALDTGSDFTVDDPLSFSETQSFSTLVAQKTLVSGKQAQVSLRFARLTADHWNSVPSDVRVQSVLRIDIRPEG